MLLDTNVLSISVHDIKCMCTYMYMYMHMNRQRKHGVNGGHLHVPPHVNGMGSPDISPNVMCIHDQRVIEVSRMSFSHNTAQSNDTRPLSKEK